MQELTHSWESQSDNKKLTRNDSMISIDSVASSTDSRFLRNDSMSSIDSSAASSNVSKPKPKSSYSIFSRQNSINSIDSDSDEEDMPKINLQETTTEESTSISIETIEKIEKEAEQVVEISQDNQEEQQASEINDEFVAKKTVETSCGYFAIINKSTQLECSVYNCTNTVFVMDIKSLTQIHFCQAHRSKGCTNKQCSNALTKLNTSNNYCKSCECAFPNCGNLKTYGNYCKEHRYFNQKKN